MLDKSYMQNLILNNLVRKFVIQNIIVVNS